MIFIKYYQQIKNLLFEFCDKNERCPNYKEQYKEQRIGVWLHHQKNKIIDYNSDIYKELSLNKYVKKSLDENIKKKELIKDNEKLTYDQMKALFFKYCNENKKCPDVRKIFEGQKIGSWFKFQKSKVTDVNDDKYKELSINKYSKDNLDKYIENKKSKKLDKGIVKLPYEQMRELLFKYCNENKKCPYAQKSI